MNFFPTVVIPQLESDVAFSESLRRAAGWILNAGFRDYYLQFLPHRQYNEEN
jgi:hypothetical protein